MNGNDSDHVARFHLVDILLPIREAYEWKPTLLSNPRGVWDLLPIREAYEWKLQILLIFGIVLDKACFQFVKRMNGNLSSRAVTSATAFIPFLASNS